jgi:hypothetical protein
MWRFSFDTFSAIVSGEPVKAGRAVRDARKDLPVDRAVR